MTGVVNNLGEKGCWNCGDEDHWKYQCLKLTEEERVALAQPGGPSLLNLASLNEDVYVAEDKYDGVTFVLPVMIQWQTLNPHYLYLDSCSTFNQVFTNNHILDLGKVKISLRARCNASTSNNQKLILGAIKAWLVRTSITNLASLPQLECD